MKQVTLLLLMQALILSISAQVNFAPGVRITDESFTASSLVESADIDGDNDIDIISYDLSALNWYENDGTNHFSLNSEIPISVSIDILKAVNSNSADTYIDLFIRESGPLGNLYNLLNNGSGSFIEASNIISGGASISVNDINGDLNVEVAVVDQTNPDNGDGISIWEINSNGEFQNENYMFFENLLSDDILLTNIDDDSDNDLIIPVIDLLGSNFHILLKTNNGSGNFSEQDTIVTEDTYFNRIYSADINGDNLNDLISITDNKIVWYENLGSNEFSAKQIIVDFTTQDTYYKVLPVDIDGDNDIDIITNSENAVVYFENTDGGGTFSSENIICTPDQINDFKTDDIDIDGDQDLIVASMEGTYLYENNPEVSINNFESMNFCIYPNPSDGKLFISLNNSENGCKVYVYDSKGSLVHSDVCNSKEQNEIDLNSFDLGLYLIKIQFGKSVYTEKIILK